LVIKFVHVDKQMGICSEADRHIFVTSNSEHVKYYLYTDFILYTFSHQNFDVNIILQHYSFSVYC
jgi:hypothetical protein